MKDFRERYINMRNEGKYDLQFFFNYYLSQGGVVRDGHEFTDIFMYTWEDAPTPPGFPTMRIKTGEIDRQAVLNHLDGVFNLLIINDKDGKFIKAIG